MTRKLCVDKIKVNEKRCKRLLEESFCLATALNPYLGYEVVAELVKRGLEKNKPLLEVLSQADIVEEKQLKRVLDARGMTEPRQIDLKLRDKIQGDARFVAFRDNVRRS